MKYIDFKLENNLINLKRVSFWDRKYYFSFRNLNQLNLEMNTIQINEAELLIILKEVRFDK